MIWGIIGICVIIVIVVSYLLLASHGVSNSNNKSQGTGTLNVSQNRNTGSSSGGNVIFGVTSPLINKTDLQAARSYGIEFIRADVAPSPQFNSFVLNATSMGFKILGILDYNTVGAKITSSGCVSGCNWTLADWNASVYNAVRAYPEIHYWEIWNEPQFPIFQDGFQDGSPYNYSLTLKSAYKIIKAHNASDTVVCMGGDNIFVYGGNQTMIDYKWAEALWSYNASNYCDIVSLHAYSDGAPLNYTIPQTNLTVGEVFNGNLDAYENVTKKPIWITEVGIPANLGYASNGTLYQEQFLNQSFRLMLSKPYVTGIFWFDMAVYPYNSSQVDYGLFNGSDFKPRPAAFEFKSFAK